MEKLNEAQNKVVNSVRWSSVTLSDWAAIEFGNGRTLEEVRFFLSRAVEKIDEISPRRLHHEP